jgi:hypothetical protein
MQSESSYITGVIYIPKKIMKNDFYPCSNCNSEGCHTLAYEENKTTEFFCIKSSFIEDEINIFLDCDF